MDQAKQQKLVVSKLEAVIEYSRAELTLSYCEIIGCLEIVKHDLLMEMLDATEDES